MRRLLVGTVVSVMVGVLPLGVTAQTGGDDPADATADAPGEVLIIPDLVYATGRSPDTATELAFHLLHPAVGSDGAPMVIDLGGSAVDHQALAERGVSVFVMFYWDEWWEVEPRTGPITARAMAEAVACAIRFARGSEYGSETAPLVLTGFSFHAGLASHVALAGEDFDRVWEEYAESEGGPPAQFDCTASEASTKVDGFVGVAGPYDALSGFEGRYGPDFLLAHIPDLWEVLDATVGPHPELRVRLLHGDADPAVPLEASTALEAVLAEAGYDVEVVEFDGDHTVPGDLVLETVLELVS